MFFSIILLTFLQILHSKIPFSRQTRQNTSYMTSWLTNWVNWVTTFRTDRWQLFTLWTCRQLDVELSWVGVAIDTSPTQLNSTSSWVELCRYKRAFKEGQAIGEQPSHSERHLFHCTMHCMQAWYTLWPFCLSVCLSQCVKTYLDISSNFFVTWQHRSFWYFHTGKIHDFQGISATMRLSANEIILGTLKRAIIWTTATELKDCTRLEAVTYVEEVLDRDTLLQSTNRKSYSLRYNDWYHCWSIFSFLQGISSYVATFSKSRSNVITELNDCLRRRQPLTVWQWLSK